MAFINTKELRTVEPGAKKGWNRFVEHSYRADSSLRPTT